MVVASLGIASFIIGILAEIKKPAAGEVITGKGVIICKYPSDPSIFLGYIATALFVAASVAGYLSLFYPYNGKSVPKAAIFGSNWCTSYILVALSSTIFAAIFLIWPTIQGHIHHTKNVHTDLEFDCTTAKTGLIGGGAFASLNSSLLWLISLMLVTNAREDYFMDTGSSEIF
ncbi:hypothetical protein PHJA_000302200 [Phtheirospermum japonicum]|uniref:Uncharacterized protein n=1 Tax=Phtheirospermum japonicum TaxID=374723 RepID=A0A830B8K0_9LAMI|nr:hypothetical protein PHJA_000302200 [Phtheirospermum japonicum]